MTISFEHSPAVTEIVTRTAELVREVAIPIENRLAGSAHDLLDDVRNELQGLR